MFNIVVIHHPYSHQGYLFSVPMGVRLRKGQEVVVQTKYGKRYGTCVAASEVVPEETFTTICRLTGAYLPLKKVVGIVSNINFISSTVKGICHSEKHHTAL